MTRFHVALREFGEMEFDFEILERCAKECLLSRERFYIALMGAAEIDGLNSRTNPTATYDFRASPVTCARISASKKGRVATLEQRARQSASQVGLKRTQASRERISAALKGRSFSKEHRAKISHARSGTKQSEASNAKRSAALMGRTFSADSKAKIRATRLAKISERGQFYSDVRKAVVVTALSGEFYAWYPSVLEAQKEHPCPRYYLSTGLPNRDGLQFHYAVAIYSLPLPSPAASIPAPES